MSRVFGKLEAGFDICYLIAALVMAVMLLLLPGSGLRLTAGSMALVLALGDSFHLVPRIASIWTGNVDKYRHAMGRGKQITSITMTIFYLLFWQVGVSLLQIPHPSAWTMAVAVLAAVRIALCLLPKNRWLDEKPPVFWGIARNIPFFFLGLAVAGLYFFGRNAPGGLSLAWLAILLSFLFYLPVVLWSNRYRKVGMLMLPKTCMYLWLIAMCFSIP